MSTNDQESLRIATLINYLRKSDSSVRIHDSLFDACKNYKFKKTIGEGSFGKVYKAKHRETEGSVAIKVITDFASCTMLIRSVIRELTILRQLTQMVEEGAMQLAPKLIEAHLFVEVGQLGIAIIMESGGKSLESLFKSSEIYADESHFTKVAYNLLCGLKFLHSAGIIHRDVKPANLLMGKGCQLRICDFGISRTLPGHHERRDSKESKENKMANPSELYQAPNGAREIGLQESEQQGRASKKSEAEEEKPRCKPSRNTKAEPNEKQHRRRSLSPHVVTRIYRPPEVILMQQTYDEKVDIWSSAVSLVEVYNSLVLSMDKREAQPFSGTSCFPLSPSANGEIDANNDQMAVILRVMGQLTDSDREFLTTSAEKEIINALETSDPKIQFQYEYPQMKMGLQKMMTRILEFNPTKRPAASDLLSCRVFDSIRDAKMEKEAPRRIEIDIDEHEIDYRTYTAPNFNEIYYLKRLAAEVDKL